VGKGFLVEAFPAAWPGSPDANRGRWPLEEKGFNTKITKITKNTKEGSKS